MPASLGYISISTVTYNYVNNTSDVRNNFEIMTITPETKPHFFTQGSLIKRSPDTSGLKSVQDPSNIVLKDNLQAQDNTILRVEVRGCDAETLLPEEQRCASAEELQEFLDKY